MPGIRARFSPERWEEFKKDMKYFIDTMGPRDYLGSMQDHGGNATPVWMLSAWLIFRDLPAERVDPGRGGVHRSGAAGDLLRDPGAAPSGCA